MQNFPLWKLYVMWIASLGAPKVCPRPSFGRSSKSSHVLPTYLGWLIQKPDAHLSLQRYKMSILVAKKHFLITLLLIIIGKIGLEC